MSKFRVSGNKSSILVYPTAKPELNLDFVNNPEGIDPAYSFTRNSAATYVGPDGYIKTAGVNQPRFDYDPVTGECKGLLVEESRTNLFTNSSNINSWTKVNATSSLSNILPPDGNNFAYKVTENSSSGYHGVRLLSYSNINNYNSYISFFAKSAERSIVFLSVTFVDDYSESGGAGSYYFDLNNGTFGNGGIGGAFISNPKIESYNNGWYRISAYINSTFIANRHINIVSGTNSTTGSYIGDNSSGFYLWGLQREKVNSFPTSYIPTSGSTVTRQPDQLVLNKTLNTQGTFFIESNPSQGVPLVADSGTSQPASSLLIDQPLNQYTRSALYYNTNKTLIMGSDNSNPEEFNFSSPANLNFNRVSLGFNRLSNDNYINGYLKKFSYYSSPLSEDNLRALTSNIKSIDRFTNLIASGGAITEIVENNINYRVHTFTTVGISYFNIYESTEIEYLVVAGGGSGGGPQTGGGAGGGGGGGGVLSGTFQITPSTFSIYVGAGGVRATRGLIGNNGENSRIYGVVESIGGGGGANQSSNGRSGGSGGGGGAISNFSSTSGGSGIVGQGNSGGDGARDTSSGPTGFIGAGGGGGGASQSGSNATSRNGGNGGDGVISTITGQSVVYGGGGGGSGADAGGTGGAGGGGDGGVNTADPGVDGLGGGGGAMRSGGTGFGERGGSGIVIIRYKV